MNIVYKTIMGMSVTLLSLTALAGVSISGNSPKFSVDTRGNELRDGFHITDVRSSYCNGEYGTATGRKATFLSGVGLTVEFEVEAEGGTILQIEVNGVTYYAPKFTVDVGSLNMGGVLTVVAESIEGTRSRAFRVNLEMASPPADASKFHVSEQNHGDSVVYRADNFSSIEFFEGVNKAFTIFKARPNIHLLPAVDVDCEVDSASGEYTWSFGLGASVNPFADNESAKKRFGRFAGADIEGQLLAAPTYRWDAGKKRWVDSSSSFGIGLSCSCDLLDNIRLPSPWSTFYVPLGFEGGGEFRGILSEDSGLQFAADFNPLLGAKAGLGAGAKALVAVEAYVQGGVRLSIQAPAMPHIERLGLQGGIGWSAVVLGMQKVGAYHDWTQWICGGPSLSSARLMRTAAADTGLRSAGFVPLARDYLNRSRPLRRLAAAAPMVGGERTVAIEGYPQPDPAVASCAGQDILAFLQDDSQRNAVNRTKLVCALGENGEYGTPNAVWDDGTPDFKPSVGLAADGTAVVAWMNGALQYADGASLDDLLSGSEIAVGIRDAATGRWTCVNLTDDRVLDHSPSVAVAKDGGVCVVWIRNVSCNLMGTTDEPNEIWGSVYANGVWSSPVQISTSIGSMSSIDMIYDGQSATIAFLEQDESGESSRVGCLTWRGAGVVDPVFVENVDSQGTAPAVCLSGDGTPILFYQDASSLKGRNIGTGEVLTYTLAANSAGGLMFAKGTDGRVAAVWMQSGASGSLTSDPFASYYDPQTDSWSGAIRLLDNGRQERGLATVLSEDGGIRLAYASVAVSKDENGAISSGAVDVRTLSRRHGMDLAVAAEDISFSTNSVFDWGVTATVCARIRNIGDVAVQGAVVNVYVGEDESSMERVSAGDLAVDVPAGGQAMVEAPWGVNLDVSNLLVRVEIDPDEQVADIDRSNNIAERGAVPSLRLGGVKSVVDREGNLRLLYATLCNTGFKSVSEGTVVTFRRADGSIIGTDTLGVILPGDNGTYEASVAWPLDGLSFAEPYEQVSVELAAPAQDNLPSNRWWTANMRVMTSLDTDGDGLLDGEELQIGTAVDNADTDGDFCSDGTEVHERHTDPLVPDKFIVIFDCGVHGTVVNGSVSQETFVAVAPVVEPNPGWKFLGWDRDFTDVRADMRITAIYEADQYPIVYENTFGAKNPNPSSYTEEDKVVFLGLPSAAGRYFVGWEPSRIDKGTTGEVTVVAKWADKPSLTIKPVVSRSDADLENEGYFVVYSADVLLLAFQYGIYDIALGCDIDLAGIERTVFSLEHAFTGKFDGNGHVIRNVQLEAPDSDCVGFFAYANHATLRNIVIENAKVTGGGPVGVLVGEAYETTIENCCVINSEVNGECDVGGLVGYAWDCEIDSCYVREVSASSPDGNNGGFAGGLYSCSVTRCFSEATVTGQEYVGGFCSWCDSCRINNVYAIGLLNADQFVGGFSCGISFCDVENVFASASVSATGEEGVGAFCGESSYNGECDKIFYFGSPLNDLPAIGAIYRGGETLLAALSCKSEAELKDAKTYIEAGWDETIWHFYPDSYPRLFPRNDEEYAIVYENTFDAKNPNPSSYTEEDKVVFLGLPSAAGRYFVGWEPSRIDKGTTGEVTVVAKWTDKPSLTIKPVVPKTEEELDSSWTVVHDVMELAIAMAFRNHKIVLGSDIDLSEFEYDWFADISRGYTFSGLLDGNGYVIRNLQINGGDVSNVGFISYANHATLRNIVIENAKVTGGKRVGVLVGMADERTIIENCCVINSEVNGAHSVGGLVGYAQAKSEIEDCYVRDVNVSCHDGACSGGLAGSLENSSVSRCFSEATVTGTVNAGGLCGWCEGCYIGNAYAIGVLKADSFSGGFFGVVNRCDVENVFASVSVSAAGEEGIGAFCGKSCNTWECNRIFCLGSSMNDLPAIGADSGGSETLLAALSCKSEAELKDAKTYIEAGWDETIWHFYPDSYPMLIPLTELGQAPDKPAVEGDEGATITGDAQNGFVVKPSEGKTTVEVSIPQDVEPTKVIVEMSPKAERVTTHGAVVKVIGVDGNGERCDITALLDIPGARMHDGGGVVATLEDGVIDLKKATVKEEVVKEAIDQEKGAIIQLNATSPTITTTATYRGLLYTFREGATLDGLRADVPQIKKGDGESWTPTITVKGGDSGFYAIGVSKGE